MTQAEFLNAIRVPWNIDRADAPDAFPETAEGDAAWREFRGQPHRFLVRCCDATFEALWPALERRLARRAGVDPGANDVRTPGGSA